MPNYRDPLKPSQLFPVYKVQTCSGQPLEVTTTSGGTWTSAGANSSVEYNLSGTSSSGGRVLAQGYFQGSNQGAPSLDILKEALFKFQLERDGLTGTPYEISVTVAANSSTASAALASMDWEEISR